MRTMQMVLTNNQRSADYAPLRQTNSTEQMAGNAMTAKQERSVKAGNTLNEIRRIIEGNGQGPAEKMDAIASLIGSWKSAAAGLNESIAPATTLATLVESRSPSATEILHGRGPSRRDSSTPGHSAGRTVRKEVLRELASSTLSSTEKVRLMKVLAGPDAAPLGNSLEQVAAVPGAPKTRPSVRAMLRA